eukprot:1161110-Pelagomonas_calceolata.AAC.15
MQRTSLGICCSSPVPRLALWWRRSAPLLSQCIPFPLTDAGRISSVYTVCSAQLKGEFCAAPHLCRITSHVFLGSWAAYCKHEYKKMP